MTLLAAGNGTTFWYVTRGSGVVALLLLTASVLVGILSALRVRNDRWPRFAVAGVHRNLTLLSIAFVALHVLTTILDGYAPIGLKDAVLPFVSSYRPLWLGFGAVAFDLLLALVITSLLRRRIGPRVWRLVHWLAYASWPVALVHAFGTGSDARTGWLSLLGFATLLAVVVAALARVALGGGNPLPRAVGALAAVAAPLVIFLWYQGGPAQHGWAARAGTPSTLLKSTRGAGTAQPTILTSAASPPRSFTSPVSGSVNETGNGDGSVTVSIVLRLHGGPGGATRVDLRGVPFEGGVSMNASGVSFVPATTRAVYTGSVVGLQGSRVAAVVGDGSGDRLQLDFTLSIDLGHHSVSGLLSASQPGANG